MKRLVSVGLALAAVCAAPAGFAQSMPQPWLGDRKLGQGAGIRAGDLELHPEVAGEIGYDSNFYRRSGDANEPTIAVYRLRVTPALFVSTLTQRRIDGTPMQERTVTFNAGVFAGLNQMFAADSANSDAVSEQKKYDIGAKLGAQFFPRQRVGVDLDAQYQRFVEPSNSTNTALNFDRDIVQGGLDLVWRPGGGLFDWRVGYQLAYTLFEREAFSSFDNVAHTLRTRARFRFLPRTALMYSGSSTWRSYPNGGQTDGQLVRSSVGLSGLVTKRFGFRAMVGWGSSFFDPQAGGHQNNYDSFLANGEVRWYLIPQAELEPEGAPVGLSNVALGYTRDFQFSYLGNFYQSDKVYTTFSYFVGGRVLLALSGAYTRNTYADSFQANGATRAPEFSLNRVDGQLFGEYRTSDSFGINATVGFEGNLGRQEVNVAPNQPPDNLGYKRYTVFAGVRWFM